MRPTNSLLLYAGALAAVFAMGLRAQAYNSAGRWSSSASGSTGTWGDPVALTWSIVPDGTMIPALYSFQGEVSSPSDLMKFLDDNIGGGPGAGSLNPADHDWFQLIQSSFDRWEELSGVNFIYEPFDDGAIVNGTNGGILGVRGDIRLSGHLIDGLNPDGMGNPQPNILAYSYFPNRGDFVLDTGNAAIFGYPEGNYLRLRNTLMHEFGHSLGLNHTEGDVDPDTPGAQLGSILMEPALAVNFDGPQLDDILGIHRLYGDFGESGTGNNTAQTASHLGLIPMNSTVGVGLSATSVRVEPTEVDFASIDYLSDVDFYSFTIDDNVRSTIQLLAAGAPYYEVGSSGLPEIVDPRAFGDLSFDLLASNGWTVLSSRNAVGPGGVEKLTDATLSPGTYYVRVAGQTINPQLYQLLVNVRPVPETASGRLAAIALAAAWRPRRRAAI
jgi:hypothetical protein